MHKHNAKTQPCETHSLCAALLLLFFLLERGTDLSFRELGHETFTEISMKNLRVLHPSARHHGPQREPDLRRQHLLEPSEVLSLLIGRHDGPRLQVVPDLVDERDLVLGTHSLDTGGQLLIPPVHD